MIDQPFDTLLAELEFWAHAHAPVGGVQAAQVLRLLDERRADKSLILGLAERIAKQSELLGKKSERAE